MRFLHTADWQIGMKAAHIGRAADKVRATRLETIQRIKQVANKEDVEFVLIAGDTFEDHGVGRDLIAQVGDLLAGFNCPVYIIPGNHDPWISSGVWDHARELWSKHVHVLTESSPVQLAGGWLYPCPLKHRWPDEDPTEWIPAAANDGIRLIMAHGNLSDSSCGELPISVNIFERTDLDYLALGHLHSVHELAWNGVLRAAYCGTPEPTKFGEADSGHVLLVEINEHGARPEIERVRVGELNWWTLEAELRCPEDVAMLMNRVKQLENASKTLVRVRLSGILFASDALRLQDLSDVLVRRFLYSELDHSALIPAPQDDAWVTDLPLGVIREAGERLKRSAQTEGNVAARLALFELYHLANSSAPRMSRARLGGAT